MLSDKFIKIFKECSIVTIACIVMAFNINYFFLGNKLGQGGVSGLSLILHYLTNIDISYIYLGLNIPLIIIAYMFIGKNFVFKTLFATLVLTIFLKVFGSFRGPIDDILMASIFGGGINGIAIGKVLLTIDFIILSMVAFIFGKVIFMYTLISLLVSAKMIDIIQEGIYSAKGVTIITNKEEELRKRIMEDTGRGITLINAKGAYTQKEIGMLYCVVGKYQLMKVKNIVKEIDPEAFMIVNQVHEVVGKGFLGQ